MVEHVLPQLVSSGKLLLQIEDSRVVEVVKNKDPLQKICTVLCDSMEVDTSKYIRVPEMVQQMGVLC